MSRSRFCRKEDHRKNKSGFSLNYHKHIHCGEGGIVVTDQDELAERLRLIRNHAEAVVEDRQVKDLNNMIGFNFRMTELEAAIARQQLKKLAWLLEERRKNVKYLAEKLQAIPCLELPPARADTEHSYYMQPLKYHKEVTGISREDYINAVKAELMPSALREKEGVTIGCGYVKPLYLQPIFQQKIGYGGTDYPFCLSNSNYKKGICPVCEKMHFEQLVTHDLMKAYFTKEDLDDVYMAFQKVYDHLEELQ